MNEVRKQIEERWKLWESAAHVFAKVKVGLYVHTALSVSYFIYEIILGGDEYTINSSWK